MSTSNENNRAGFCSTHIRQKRIRDINCAKEVRLKLLQEPFRSSEVNIFQNLLLVVDNINTYPTSSAIPGAPTPALFTTTSTRPQISTACFPFCLMISSESVTSSCNVLQFSDSRCFILSKDRAEAITRSPRERTVFVKILPKPADVPEKHFNSERAHKSCK